MSRIDLLNPRIGWKRTGAAMAVAAAIAVSVSVGCSQPSESILPPSERDLASVIHIVSYFRAAEDAADKYRDRVIFVGSTRAVNNLRIVLENQPGDFSASIEAMQEFEVFIQTSPPESTTEPTAIITGAAAVSEFIAQAAPQPDVLFVIDTGMQIAAPWASELVGWTRTSPFDPILVRSKQ